MANSLAHSYQPSAGALGGVSLAAGKGQFAQKLGDKKENRYQLQAQADLQQQGQLLGAAIDIKRMNNQLALQQQQQAMDWQRMLGQAQLAQNQQAMQYDLQRMEQDDNLAYRQLLGQQQLELQRELSFAELDQQTQIQQLRNRPEASAAYQQLQAKRQYLDQALSEQFITPEMHQQLVQQHAMEVAGFNPQNYAYQGQFEPGREIGDVWQETRQTPMGEMTLDVTRDRSGQPVLAEWSKIQYENAIKAHYDKTQGKTLDAAKPAVTLKDYASMYSTLAESMSSIGPNEETIPADPAAVEERMGRLVDSYQSRFGVTQPGGGWAGLSMPQSLQGMVGGELNQPTPRPGAYNVPQAPPMQPPTAMPPIQEAFGTNLPPLEFAQQIVAHNPTAAAEFLATKYQDSLTALMAAREPSELATYQMLQAITGKK